MSDIKNDKKKSNDFLNDDNIVVNSDNQTSKKELTEEIEDNAIEELLILKQTIEEKNELIEKLKLENEETKNLLIRLKADFENYKKRVREEQKDMVKFSNIKLIIDLLPILDDLDRAVSSVSEEIKQSSFFEGLNMVKKSLHNLLEKKFYLESIDSENVVFDPNYHEAISLIEDNNIKGMIVDKVLQKGYKIDSRVLRSAKVVVRKGVVSSENESAKTNFNADNNDAEDSNFESDSEHKADNNNNNNCDINDNKNNDK
ncbi:MAG: nucleotide exchange factor GrpE [Exilispira sp.]